jgi:PIN domain nuclease of toxin-antitoxin system
MILDTCAVLWLATGDKKLSRAAVKAIDEAAVVYVSAISGFEIAIKERKGKLKLPCAAEKWLEDLVEHHGLSVLPLDMSICIRAAELPWIHDDPCDRFIIATAKLNGLDVVTGDARFEKYGVQVIG